MRKICLPLVFLIAGCSLANAANTATSLKTYNDIKTYKCPPPDNEKEKLCQHVDIETDVLFFDKPILPDAVQIDVRPENCLSFFDDYLDTRRGLRIESALEATEFYKQYESTVSTFPVIDFYVDGVVRVVKTRDLAADSFNDMNNENALFDQIIRDAKQINDRFVEKLNTDTSITATMNGKTTTINKGEINQIMLDIVVQTGLASNSQTNQIKRAKEEILRRWGYKLQLIEIP